MTIAADLAEMEQNPAKGGRVRVIQRARQVLDHQRGYLFHWVPVFLAVGIGVYFGLRFEPELAHYAIIGCAVACLVAICLTIQAELRPIPTALILMLVGIVIAGARSHWVAEPVLGFRYYGAIEGRIVAVDRSQSDKTRLTLDQVVLERLAPERTPERVRVSLHGGQYFDPEPGLRIMTTGHLSPPQGPVEPGGFDFRRNAWFNQLGAVGYTRSPALVSGEASDGASGLMIASLRLRMSLAVQKALPGRTGAFAAAVTTGDRSGMGQDVLEDLRSSNLAHLLAISGLHMGLLTGFIFAALRIAIACVPWVALRVPAKKVAALIALLAGAFYYAMSGGNVATERAFIMVAVMFCAILFDRRAITLRAVAIAAVIVLMFRPETLVSPGFQMSFAATTALVAVFDGLRSWTGPSLPKWARPLMGLVVSSAVAGLATAPVAAAHFNRMADYGLIANLLSVPMMGMIVMPGAVLAAVLWPLGLAWVGLMVMKPGIDWILFIAEWVANLDGSVTYVVSPAPMVLPIFALGALFVILWRGRFRFLGMCPMILAVFLWVGSERPPLLVAESGGLMGHLSSAGRVVSKSKGDGFSARSWLENDGDGASQSEAFERGNPLSTKGLTTVDLEGHTIALVYGRNVENRLPAICDSADLIILRKVLDDPAPCPVYDARRLRQTGALAVFAGEQGLRIVGARQNTGERLWSGARPR